MAEHKHLSQIDPEFAKLPRPPTAVGPVDISTFRDNFKNRVLPAQRAATKDLIPPESEYQVIDHHIEIEDGVELLARSTVPTRKPGEDGRFPLLFWLHGGGWILGNADMDDYYHRRLTVDHRISIVNLEYRLAPEHGFPIPINDSLAALKHIISNPDRFSADLTKGFLIGGSSAGANIATALTHLVLDNSEEDPVFQTCRVTGQILVHPVIIHPSAYPVEYQSSLLSRDEIVDVPGLTKAAMDVLWNYYNPPPSDPRASPLLFDSHKDLPPTFIQVAGLDPLRDEGLLYEKVLRESGVKTRIETYPGVPHGFHMIYSQLEMTKKFRKDLNLGLGWLLKGEERK
ncbi:hypothetical protein L218DRAFT_1079797 [Marasmius fiardii PR-910]|nr:hypothetical protein L218DRAFT_1079797 [Marasmius fiardii PR-910]